MVGFAGTEAKCAWLKELGFDHAFNYKTCDIDKSLKEGAPKGVDCYFDNVGHAFIIQPVYKLTSNVIKLNL